jgi:hydrogenase/urease accessory protein HupE
MKRNSTENSPSGRRTEFPICFLSAQSYVDLLLVILTKALAIGHHKRGGAWWGVGPFVSGVWHPVLKHLSET